MTTPCVSVANSAMITASPLVDEFGLSERQPGSQLAGNDGNGIQQDARSSDEVLLIEHCWH